ncbi:hypothetical protein F5876DRAFT_68805 [Lentinula aff. lateritia]|uniref:Uncharacterized protein n=1 Tax=Lentinula aff. lateritia TaxID=2804960 RepID=A0ACC1TPU2_9AGAR|nr:hypothetical protein F5876DRAFT_68805 [Lentinula aff. lateritia]
MPILGKAGLRPPSHIHWIILGTARKSEICHTRFPGSEQTKDIITEIYVNAIGTEKSPMFKSSIVTATTLLLWDYILTFQSEGRPKNGVTFLFLTNRYLAVVAQLVTTYAHVSSNVTYECLLLVSQYKCGSVAFIGPDDNVYAMWGLCGAAQLAPGFKQCTVYTQYHNLWLFWLFIQYRRNRKEWTSNLLELLLNDMLLYLAIIFVAFIGNAILFANPDVGNHMLLNLRAESKRAAQGMIYQSGVRDPGTLGPGEGGRRNIPEQGDLGITGTGLETMVFTTATV